MSEEVTDSAPILQKYPSPHDKDDEEYQISRGLKLALIFNHMEYKDHTLATREGTIKDSDSITDTFERLGFQVENYLDLDLEEIEAKLFKLRDRKDISCLAIFVMTHGSNRGTLWARDKSYTLGKDIVAALSPHNCPGLVSFPKLIFIQACQGLENEPGVLVMDEAYEFEATPENLQQREIIPRSHYILPHHSDFFIALATYFDHLSYRNIRSGSWFMQCLCDALDASSTSDDVHDVLRRVKHEMATEKGQGDDEDYRQMPVTVDTLIRKLRLNFERTDRSGKSCDHGGRFHASVLYSYAGTAMGFIIVIGCLLLFISIILQESSRSALEEL